MFLKVWLFVKSKQQMTPITPRQKSSLIDSYFCFPAVSLRIEKTTNTVKLVYIEQLGTLSLFCLLLLGYFVHQKDPFFFKICSLKLITLQVIIEYHYTIKPGRTRQNSSITKTLKTVLQKAKKNLCVTFLPPPPLGVTYCLIGSVCNVKVYLQIKFSSMFI